MEMIETYHALQDYDARVLTFVLNSSRNKSGNVQAMSGNFQILPAAAINQEKIITVFGAFFFQAQVKYYR